MKVQTYSLDDIFNKHLLMLLPFYIFSYENSFPEYNSNVQKLAELEAEYKEILERLSALENQGKIGTFDRRTIIELSRDVIKETAQKYENVQKGVGGIMGGALIETEARKLKDEGRQEGRREGRQEGRQEGMVYAYYEMNMNTNEIASKVNLTETEVLEIIKKMGKF